MFIIARQIKKKDPFKTDIPILNGKGEEEFMHQLQRISICRGMTVQNPFSHR